MTDGGFLECEVAIPVGGGTSSIAGQRRKIDALVEVGEKRCVDALPLLIESVVQRRSLARLE